MDITPLVSKDANVINGYGSGYFTVNNKKYDGSIIISENMVADWWVNNFEDLDIDDFEMALSTLNSNIFSEYEIILLGTGSKFRMPPQSFINRIKISLDYMDSGAAARTYNILLSEGRKVLAALIMI